MDALRLLEDAVAEGPVAAGVDVAAAGPMLALIALWGVQPPLVAVEGAVAAIVLADGPVVRGDVVVAAPPR